MKKFLLKARLIACMLVGLFAFGFSSSEANAQLSAPSNDLFSNTADAFKAPNEALDILAQEIAGMNNYLQFVNDFPVEMKRKFYNEIHIAIEQNQPVPFAINGSYVKFAPNQIDAPVEVPNPLPLATWQGYYQEVVALLRK